MGDGPTLSGGGVVVMAGVAVVLLAMVALLVVASLVGDVRARRAMSRRVGYVWLPAPDFDPPAVLVERWATRAFDRAASRRVPARARALVFRIESDGGRARFTVEGPPQAEQALRQPWQGVQTRKVSSDAKA